MRGFEGSEEESGLFLLCSSAHEIGIRWVVLRVGILTHFLGESRCFWAVFVKKLKHSSLAPLALAEESYIV